MYHKETFYQPADDGIPAHWVVQYWESREDAFCQASYFDSEEDALEFEELLVKENE